MIEAGGGSDTEACDQARMGMVITELQLVDEDRVELQLATYFCADEYGLDMDVRNLLCSGDRYGCCRRRALAEEVSNRLLHARAVRLALEVGATAQP